VLEPVPPVVPPEPEPVPPVVLPGGGDPGAGEPVVELVVVPEFLDEPPPQLTTSSNEGNIRRVIRASRHFSSNTPDRHLGREIIRNSNISHSGETVLKSSFESYDAEAWETCRPGGADIFALILRARPVSDSDSHERTSLTHETDGARHQQVCKS